MLLAANYGLMLHAANYGLMLRAANYGLTSVIIIVRLTIVYI